MQRFDESMAWRALSAEDQESLGCAAIAWAVALCGAEVVRDAREERAMLAAGEQAASDIEHITDRLFPKDRIPGVPNSLGPVCRECGCSNFDA